MMTLRVNRVEYAIVVVPLTQTKYTYFTTLNKNHAFQHIIGKHPGFENQGLGLPPQFSDEKTTPLAL